MSCPMMISGESETGHSGYFLNKNFSESSENLNILFISSKKLLDLVSNFEQVTI